MPDSRQFPSIKLQTDLAKAPPQEGIKHNFVWNAKHEALIPVEEYIKEKAANLDINLEYDMTAVEELYFKTINYTTYAGFVILHPFNLEQSMRQMMDAYADNMEDAGHIGLIEQNINDTQRLSKYTNMKPTKEKAKVIVVLPGGNKLKKHCCVGKIKWILEKHGRENVLFKRHPVSYTDVYNELNGYLGGINYCDVDSNLYDLIKEAEYVYTTMISESALISYMMGKKVGHFDLWQNRNTGSFTHINHFLFSTPDPVQWARTAFASPKSGVIHPDADKNWKKKIDDYFDYILNLREFYKDAYVMRK